MNPFRWYVAGLAIIALAACGQGRDGPVAPAADRVETASANDAIRPYLDLVDAPFVIANASEADLDAITAALPDFAQMEWDTKTLDAATGATVLTGLSISFGDDAAFGIRVDEARVWGMESDLLAARLQGQRLDESGPLFARFDASNLSYFGLGSALNLGFEQILFQFGAELPPETELSFDAFEITSQKLILTDVALRPWQFVKAPASLVDDIDGTDDRALLLSAIHLGQQFVAASRSVEYGSGVILDTATRFSMRQPGATVTGDSRLALYGFSDVIGFDFGQLVIKDARTRQETTYSDMDPALGTGLPPGLSLVQESAYALSQIQDVRLDAVMGYLARSELPPIDQRDLMSLGLWQATDYTLAVNDKLVFSVETASLQADKFEWVLPSNIGYEFNNATLHVDELTGVFKSYFEIMLANPDIADGDQANQEQLELIREGFDNALELLPQHGLDTISFDASARAVWDADAGPSEFSAAVMADGFGEGSYDLSLDLPTYDQVTTAVQAEDREAVFGEIFQAAFAFRSAHSKETDTGGFDKLFGYAHAIGKAYPDQGWGAMLGSMEPPQMRAYLANMMRLGASQVGAEFPPAIDWFDAFANYIETGGTLEIKVDPPAPITAALIEGFDGEPEPEEIVEIFGISVTHTK